MDTLLIILLALTTVAIPALTEAAAAARIFDAWGARGLREGAPHGPRRQYWKPPSRVKTVSEAFRERVATHPWK